LLSREFIYFGRAAPEVPLDLLARIGYWYRIDHLTFEDGKADKLIEWLHAR
jgi:hypothetical protein